MVVESSELNSGGVREWFWYYWFGELTVVVDPDTSAVLDCDAVVVYDFADGEVAEDDIRRVDD
jgi:hypothetical protein